MSRPLRDIIRFSRNLYTVFSAGILLVLLLASACVYPPQSPSTLFTPTIILPTLIPTPLPTQVPSTLATQPILSLTFPTAFLVNDVEDKIAQVIDLEGTQLDALNYGDIGNYVQIQYVMGSTPDGLMIPPLLLEDSVSAALLLYQDGSVTDLPGGNYAGVIVAKDTDLLAFCKYDITDQGIHSQLYATNQNDFLTAEPVYETFVPNTAQMTIPLPLLLVVVDGQPSVIWFAVEPINSTVTTFYPNRYGLYYLDLTTSKVQQRLKDDRNPSDISQDAAWVASTSYFQGGDASLTLIELAHNTQVNFPLAQGSDLGAGYALISPEDAHVAWTESGGSLSAQPITFQTRLRIGGMDGSILYDLPGEQFAAALGARQIENIRSVAWANADTVVVEVGALISGIHQDTVMKVSLLDGSIQAVASGTFFAPLFPGGTPAASTP